VAVTLTVTAPPAMALSTTTLGVSVQQGQNAAAQSFTLRNSGGGTLSYAVGDDQPWLSVSPTSGTSAGESDTIAVSFSSSALPVGTHTATITASARPWT
jgi:hypothetical protein